jgi:hypothetical protein
MWALRVLTGPQAGQILDLKMGRNVIGRGATCDIKLISQGVSKEHSELHVYKDKIIMTDLQSSNGSYINGVRMQNGLIRLGDKVSVHDVIFDVIPADAQQIREPAQYSSPPRAPQNGNAAVAHQFFPDSFEAPGSPEFMHSEATPQMMGHVNPGPMPSPRTERPEGIAQNLWYQVKDYVERVALPGVYRLPQLTEFKYVLGGFIAMFIVAVTLLSMIPMVQITRSSIMAESQRRAQSIARNVAMTNQALLLQGSYSSLDTHSAETEDGVKQVMIVQQSDGMVLAPASRAGTTSDIPFVHISRREMKAQVAKIDSQTIGASFPIGQYDPSTGEPSVKAHAIVIYDVGSLAFDDGHVLSLFFQTLIIACIVGLLLFFFMYKLIEYPINTLNEQLDIALREKKDSTEVEFQFPALQNLIGNVNSLLTRYIHGDAENNGPVQVLSRDAEAENLVQLMGYPTIAISGEKRIIAVNTNFEQIAHANATQLNGQQLSALSDGALQQNLLHLIQKSTDVPGTIHSDQLEFSGHNCLIHCQAMGVDNNTIAYFIVSITPTEGGES